MKQLDDQAHVKLRALEQWDRDCADTVKWLRENRHRFKMEVFEPPMLSLQVPNKNFASAVETLFSANDMRVRLELT